MDEASDAGLIARVLADDDRGAFAALVNRHQPAVRGLLRRLCGGDAAVADDLAQETFLRAYRGLPAFRGGARLSTWLHRVAYNVFLTHAARSGRRDDLEPPAARAGAADTALLRYDLERAMAALRPPEAAALTLSYVDLLSHDEISQVLGCPVGTVKTHIARGKEKLRALMGDWADQRGEAS
jgi:RNA polymerase sigma-70 factor (ECF subfamily)